MHDGIQFDGAVEYRRSRHRPDAVALLGDAGSLREHCGRNCRLDVLHTVAFVEDSDIEPRFRKDRLKLLRVIVIDDDPLALDRRVLARRRLKLSHNGDGVMLFDDLAPCTAD